MKDVKPDDAAKKVIECLGAPADIVIECCGFTASIETAIKVTIIIIVGVMVAKGGASSDRKLQVGAEEAASSGTVFF